MNYKAIFQGKLEFGSERSQTKAQTMFLQRVETIYKKEIIFKTPEIFNPTDFTLNVGRNVSMATDKIWRNTISGLEFCAQFAMSGNIKGWLTDNGKIMQFTSIEPSGDKASIISYNEGVKLIEESGKELEAIQALTQAIEKYERHSQAYEKRGYVNFQLGNPQDAIYDFTKSIHFDDFNASSYFGRAKVYLTQKKFDLALADFTESVKKSVALQSLHWMSRRNKGNCHLALGQYTEAMQEYKFFVARNYEPGDSNIKHLSYVWYNLGKSLFELNKLNEALEAFDKSLALGSADRAAEYTANTLLERGRVRKMVGNPDFISDFREASKLGSESATKLLSENA